MDECVKKFFRRNDINPKRICQCEEGKIKSPKEINSIVANYAIRRPVEWAYLSIEDIVGYDNCPNDKSFITDIIENFFGSKGGDYLRRSIGLLDYTTIDALQKIDFRTKEMFVNEMDDNIYIMSINGIHRYIVLRLLYLSEYVKAKGNKGEIDRLKEKYKIEVKLSRLDKIKTYCKFLLMTSKCGIKDIEAEYDGKNWRYTGRFFIIKKNNEKIVIETDEDLIEYVRNQAKIINQSIGNLQWYYGKYESFRNFLEEYFADTLDIKQLDDGKINEEKGNIDLW